MNARTKIYQEDPPHGMVDAALGKAMLHVEIKLPPELAELDVTCITEDKTKYSRLQKRMESMQIRTLEQLIDNWNELLVKKVDYIGVEAQKMLRTKIMTLLVYYGCVKQLSPSNEYLWRIKHQKMHEQVLPSYKLK